MWTRRFDGLAAGSRLGEHDHGASDALLLPLAGRLTLRDRDSEASVKPAKAASR